MTVNGELTPELTVGARGAFGKTTTFTVLLLPHGAALIEFAGVVPQAVDVTYLALIV